jgi:hypothetical protein
LALLNDREPRKPRCAESGEGCADKHVGVALAVDAAPSVVGASAPQEEGDRVRLRCDHGKDLVDDGTPEASAVASRSALANRQRRVEEQHAVAGPRDQ